MANDIRSDYWRHQLNAHAGERSGAPEVDSALGVSDGDDRGLPPVCFVRLHGGKFLYLRREYINGVFASESFIEGGREDCERNIPAGEKTRMGLPR